jgi:hypothetical protein
MRRKFVGVLMLVVGLTLSWSTTWALESSIQPTGLYRYNKAKALQGYTLVTHNYSPRAFLLDMEGKVVHKWQMKYNAGLFAMLLPNGNLLAGGQAPQKEMPVNFGGTGGYITEYDWNGNVVWEWKETSDKYTQHHCFERMPNGNTLVLGWEYKSYEEAVAKGRDPKTLNPDGFDAHGKIIKGIWPDYVKEISPDKKVVWEWHAWDHVGTGPDQWDINFILPKNADYMAGPDWTHFNTSSYDAKNDKIILNSRNFGEFYIIDHKTGKMEYRWGNPCAYGKGKCPSWIDDGDQQLFGPHDASMEDNGNILVFDNGWYRPQGERSRVLEVDPKTGKIVWQWASQTSAAFYTRYQGAVQKLPNGNYFISSTHYGHLIEVTGDKKAEIVWEWFSPLSNDKPGCFAKDETGNPFGNALPNQIHRAFRYAKDYPAFKGKDLSKKEDMVPGGCLEVWKVYDKEEAKAAKAAAAKAPAKKATK